jgi:hypothetical protein
MSTRRPKSNDAEGDPEDEILYPVRHQQKDAQYQDPRYTPDEPSGSLVFVEPHERMMAQSELD